MSSEIQSKWNEWVTSQGMMRLYVVVGGIIALLDLLVNFSISGLLYAIVTWFLFVVITPVVLMLAFGAFVWVLQGFKGE